MLLDKGMADVVCKAVQAEEGLKDDVHVASVAQVGEPALGETAKREEMAHSTAYAASVHSSKFFLNRNAVFIMYC